MKFTAQQIAEFLKGTVEGNPDVSVSDFSKIEEGKPGTLSFLANPKYTHYIYDCQSDIILVNRDFVAENPVRPTLIRVENAYQSLAELMSLVEQFKPRKTGISSLTEIAASAQIGDDAYIAPYNFIGERVKTGSQLTVHAHCSIADDVVIGNRVTIFAGVTIYKGCVIGDDCILHAGVVIGSDGFGFAPTEDGSYKKIPQMGNVILENNVEIGANSVVDRATLGSTIVRQGVKIDNLVQIAHNVEIGKNTVIAAQTGIAGSTKVGQGCIMGGQVGIAGHLEVADHTTMGAKTGITGSVKTPGQIYSGFPALPASNFRRSSVVIKNLPEMQKMLNDLIKRVEELEKND